LRNTLLPAGHGIIERIAVHIRTWKDRAISYGIRASLLLAVAVCGFAGTNARAPFGAFLAADLDGDKTPDFATAGALRADGAGYLLDISVRLSAVESGTITVRTSRAAGRIAARDLDGDADRDLILESFDRVPLAIVLNDGGGHFHQVNLDEYRALAQRPEPCSVEQPVREADSPDTGESTVSPADAPGLAVSRPDAVRALRLRPRNERLAASAFPARASRAPPALL
jgi:hypothetical protein